MQNIITQLAIEINARNQQIEAAIKLLDNGATVPFIARYRKEATDGLDDVQLRLLQNRLEYLRELEYRRSTIIKSINEQGKLTLELKASIMAAESKQTLEDLYLPYRTKRRTKASIAKEASLEPLADKLFNDPTLTPSTEAAAFVLLEKTHQGDDFSTIQLVLDGVRDILSERWAEDVKIIQDMREWLWRDAELISKKIAGKSENDPDVAKFTDYFDFSEALHKTPSHRALAMFRGSALQILDLKIQVPEIEKKITQDKIKKSPLSLVEAYLARLLHWKNLGHAGDEFIKRCVVWTWRVKLSLSLERELFSRLKENAESTAINVFSDNLRNLLLAAPAGEKVILGLDPGIRTGVKVALISTTGQVLTTQTIYPHAPRNDWNGSLLSLVALCQKFQVDLIAIGNGTASRETDKLASEVIAFLNEKAGSHPIQKIVVSEAGASVYSASKFASEELANLDVSLRGAVSIARRLQEPLAELVKIDPKSIGVGQYQHDVNQSALSRTLDRVIEDCVNQVGVDLNTASVPLLSKISGLSNTVAKSIVKWRDAQGAFSSRKELLKVTGLGPKAFEQCAGFLRIRGGVNALDISGVHPESYPIVEKILTKLGKPITEVMGKSSLISAINPDGFISDSVGVITVRNILSELEKPDRDPRPHFQVVEFKKDIQEISDLKIGMTLKGTVTNVAAFGAFVDLGVHQDGLVHISQLSHKFVKDAREIVKTGEIVQVQVIEIDIPRKRISLTLKTGAVLSLKSKPHEKNIYNIKAKSYLVTPSVAPAAATSIAAAFAKLKK